MQNIEKIYKEWYQEVVKQQTANDSGNKEPSSAEIDTVVIGNDTSLKSVLNVMISDTQSLRKWLNQQPFETTKVLQALLYIGRDEDLRSGTTAQEVYNNQRTSLDKTGWNALDIEVRQITGKVDAVEQIRKGYEYLRSLPKC